MNLRSFMDRLFVISAVAMILIGLFSILSSADGGKNNASAYPALPDSSVTGYPGPGGTQPSQQPFVSDPTPEPPLSEAAQAALMHIANRDNISPENLTVSSDYRLEFPNLDRQFQIVTLVNSQEGQRGYKLFVDLDSGQVIEDGIGALYNAEAEAYRVRYGALTPELSERLQTINSNEVVAVAVWVAAKPGQTLTELRSAIYSDWTSRHPEVETALQQRNIPWHIDNPLLVQQLREEFFNRIDTAMALRTSPLVQELERRGFAVTMFEGVPTFTATLPKRVLLELSRRPDVDAIYLNDPEIVLELDSAVATGLAPVVWDRGIATSNEKIAVIDPGNVDRDNFWLNVDPQVLVGHRGETHHATHVASGAASSRQGTRDLRGMAPGATIISAGIQNPGASDAFFALQWATRDRGANIVNISTGFQYDPDNNGLHWIDRIYDYWAEYQNVLIMNSAGNDGGRITSPGRGWNVFTVGGYYDENDTDWSNDQMMDASNYINPCIFRAEDSGDPDDNESCGVREKPEIAAVGGSVTAVANNNNIQTRWGTSYASAQVAGLTALIQERDEQSGSGQLKSSPLAARSIIMASATHNIEGRKYIKPSARPELDARDGAGAINAALADEIAQTRGGLALTCLDSCWGAFGIDGNFTSGTVRVEAKAGNRVRFVVSWWAHADAQGNTDILDTDLDLYAIAPSGTTVLASDRGHNNYEMVDFVAPEDGEYRFVIEKRSGSNANEVGFAALRDTNYIYLPLTINDGSSSYEAYP